MEILEEIKSRRSVHRYQPTPINNKTIGLVLDIARWVLFWANIQCQRFIVVRNASIKDKPANSLMDVASGDRLVENPSIKTIRSAPLVNIACAALGKAG